MSDYDKGRFAVFGLLCCSYYGKCVYFYESVGRIYSRASGKYLTLDEAICEFAIAIGREVE